MNMLENICELQYACEMILNNFTYDSTRQNKKKIFRRMPTKAEIIIK